MQIEMTIKGLMVDPITNMPIVILRDKEGQKVLPIWVGIFEANAIALQIENIATPRPMTHDLLRNVITDLRHTPVTSFRTGITAVAVAGEVLIIVPPGMRAIAGRVTRSAGYTTLPDASPPAGPLVPVIEANCYALLGDVRVRRVPMA